MPTRLRVLVLLALLSCVSGCQQAEVRKKRDADPETLAQVNTQLAIEYIQKGDLDVAIDRLNRALKADPDYVDAHNTFGLLHSNLGQYDEAERSFKL
jgi:type IV pilus assembly protein PilF